MQTLIRRTHSFNENARKVSCPYYMCNKTKQIITFCLFSGDASIFSHYSFYKRLTFSKCQSHTFIICKLITHTLITIKINWKTIVKAYPDRTPNIVTLGDDSQYDLLCLKLYLISCKNKTILYFILPQHECSKFSYYNFIKYTAVHNQNQTY